MRCCLVLQAPEGKGAWGRRLKGRRGSGEHGCHSPDLALEPSSTGTWGREDVPGLPPGAALPFPLAVMQKLRKVPPGGNEEEA